MYEDVWVILLLLLAIIAAVVILVNGIKIVRPYEQAVYIRLGSYIKTLNPRIQLRHAPDQPGRQDRP